jgi:D-arabinose 1-dehydrogenase-like Zn-dependent alcohol dehydrogenase
MPEFKTFRGSESGEIKEGSTKKELGPNDVLIEITHSGLCGTDLHYKSNDMALGHEGVGIVRQMGANAHLFKFGDRVGWGYVHHSCGHCKYCLTGFETFCPEREIYGEANLQQGSIGSHAIWDENYIFAVPENMKSEHAAPLMCGGATVFNSLKLYNVRPTDRVGIIGVGGLGHLAIQFASKMGCKVVVFSGTDSKRDEATKLGASEFYATKGVKELKVAKQIDHLLVTTASQPDWNLYTPVLAPEATIYPLTVDSGNLEFPYMPLIMNGWRLQGSMVAARQIHKEMLEFAVHHGIKPITQTFPMSKEGVEEAFKILEDGKMRYRGVLVV